MLPDFPAYKHRARAQLFRAVERRVPELEPILGEIQHTRVHEGNSGHLTRADESTQSIGYERASANLSVPREQMRSISQEQLVALVTDLASQIANHQAGHLIATIERATEESGNVVSAATAGAKAAFLEMERLAQAEFDPITLEPKGMVLLLHPDEVERMRAQVASWESDPEFQAERAKNRAMQLEAWRARESNRQLVD